MSSFDTFQELMGSRAYHDPLADADRGVVEIEGLEPGDAGVSEDLSGIDAALAEEELEHRHAKPKRESSDHHAEPEPPPSPRMAGGSGGGGW